MKRLLFLWAVWSLGDVKAQAERKVSPLLIARIAQEERIPVRLLQGIVAVESDFQSWAVNVQGKGYVFKTQGAAAQFLDRLFNQGMTSMDIGCAQINWQWHGQHFRHPKDLLVPQVSLRYAARLLRRHGQESRSWMQAAVRYHSSQAVYQQRYRHRLIQALTPKRLAG